MSGLSPDAPRAQPPRASRGKQGSWRPVRWLILLAVWALITVVLVKHQAGGPLPPSGAPTVDALCPFGGLETLYHFAREGTYLTRIQPSALVLLGGTLLLALVFRRAFCGWICPLGAMQELCAGVGRKLRLPRLMRWNTADRWLRYVKYPVLVLIILFTYRLGELFWRGYDPWAAYAHVPAGWGEIREEFLWGALVLVAALVVSAVIERPWCRYVCPLGGMLGIACKPGVVRLRRDDATCLHCASCALACPVDIPVHERFEVTDAECLMCGECVSACPRPSVLQFRSGRRAISPLLVGLATVLVFFGTIGLAKATGVWKSMPASAYEVVAPDGVPDPEQIRGSLKLQQVAEVFGVPAERIAGELGLPEPLDTGLELKELRDAEGERIPLSRVRRALNKLLGRPAKPEAEEHGQGEH